MPPSPEFHRPRSLRDAIERHDGLGDEARVVAGARGAAAHDDRRASPKATAAAAAAARNTSNWWRAG